MKPYGVCWKGPCLFVRREVTLANTPIMYKGSMYVATDDDFARYWNLDAQYLPDADMPYFAYKPILVIDDLPTCRAHDDASAGRGLISSAKEQLKLGLENMIKNNPPSGFVGTGIRSCEKEIRKAIADIEFVGWAGRCMMLTGPYPMLVDQYTQKIYFYQHGASFCRVVKADADDPDLFTLDYIGNL